jgi:hypothetical protein
MRPEEFIAQSPGCRQGNATTGRQRGLFGFMVRRRDLRVAAESRHRDVTSALAIPMRSSASRPLAPAAIAAQAYSAWSVR